MNDTKRADVVLVGAGLFESRSKASAAIAAGLVSADGRPVLKASTLIRPDAVIASSPAFPWVSRGGIKLAAGLDAFDIDPTGQYCLDVGASTGGFTHVLLARGAAHVTAVDVGRQQFHSSLRDDRRVSLLEEHDIRSVDAAALGQPFDVIVCDVSFISLKLVLPPIFQLAAVAASAVVLVKPQFEAGPKLVKKGIVRDQAVHRNVCDAVIAVALAHHWQVLGLMPSPIEGGDGNREFLLGLRRAHEQ